MHLAEVRATLARVSYRRGERWTFRADQIGEDVRVRMCATVLDSRQPGRLLDLGIDTWPPADALEGEGPLVRWLLGRLIEHEVHEAREWLRLDGEQVDDPHGPMG